MRTAMAAFAAGIVATLGLAAGRMSGGAGSEPRIPTAAAMPVAMSAAMPAARGASDGPVDFATEVLPVLASKCFRCHGGVREMAGLNLAEYARVTSPLRSGRTAVVAGDLAASEMVSRIRSSDANERMPPEGASLAEDEIRAIERWVAEGARWGTHWAFTAREEPPAPVVADASWIARPLDRFVLARLEQAGLGPAPRADRATLARRAALDLTGIPPDDALRAAYLSDPAADDVAYARFVDALLANPAYGERFARVWMDLGRYADTQGYEKDNRREIWAWRDWVIDALNADMPYDDFAVRMLAGDMLVEEGRSVAADVDRLATAFHRNTLTNTEGGTDNEEFRMAAVFDRVSTTWQSFLGVTFQCVQCHGHPYDPISHREYFSFLAYLNQTEDADRDDDAPRLELERAGVKTSTPVMRELPAESRRKTHVLARGALSSPQEEVAPGVPAALGMAGDAPTDRLGMARWVSRADNPLFARVAANRAWELFFGRGIVETSEDFGVMGSGASDQALLDHLAGVLIERGFSMKALLREIVLSETYRQTSVASEEALMRDPDNRLWSRAPRVRLEAEQIRDTALAASGLLSRKMGGPPVMPPQPEGVWQVVYSGDAWTTSEGEDRYRRAIYTFLRRSSPYPSFIAFDATSRETCTVRRIRTNTPLAALVMLNDPVYLEAAQALAVSARTHAVDAAAVRAMLERALGRTAHADEVARLVALVGSERERYAGNDAPARVLAGRAADGSVDLARDAALVAAANVILNLDDFLTRP
jgi:cytochrome c553